ncbi:EpsG family protein [Treponema brennaborense]|nr:EpsG family protein [Treponema brennaborense]
MLLDNKKEFLFPHKQYLVLDNGKKILFSRGTSYFPFLIFLLGTLLFASSFQYIDTSNAGRWGTNDLPRYYFSFNDADRYSFSDFFISNMQEPLYLLCVWIFRRILKSFSLFLVFVYTFHFIALKNILNCFKIPFAFFSILAIYSLCFTTVIVSFCVLRMGIAVSWSYYFYIFLRQKKFGKSFVTMLVAIGFHFSAVFLVFPLVLYKLFRQKSIKSILYFFAVTFLVEFAFALLIPFFVPFLSSRYVTYISTNDNAIAVSTYFSTFLIVILMLIQRQKFEDERNKLLFIIVLSVLYILPLQRVLSIFYRLIFFTYCSTAFALIEIVSIYKKSGSEILYLGASAFSVLYVLLFLNSFFCNALKSYGLLNYSIPYFY